MILIAVFTSSTVAMLTAEGFGFIGSVVDEDGSVNHTLSLSLVCLHRVLCPPRYTKGYTFWRHDDAVLRGAVGAKDDGALVAIHIQSVPPPFVLTRLWWGIFL